jgi:hypothetical protein
MLNSKSLLVTIVVGACIQVISSGHALSKANSVQSTSSRQSSPSLLGAPIRITWNDEVDCDWGTDIEHYISIARRQKEAMERRNPSSEVSAQGSTLVNRPWGGLTVTAVSVSYETSSIHFREPPSIVAAQLALRGFQIEKSDESDGWVVSGRNNPLDYASSGVEAATTRFDRRLGNSSWFCGV